MRPTVFSGGEPVALAERIGKGGEGEVFAVAGAPRLPAKLYAPDGAARREEKIAAMVEAGLGEGQDFVAFPRALVHDASGRFGGFLMPRVTGAEPLHELYAPGPRKQRFPQADYRFLVRAALNVARAVATTHAAGCVIGDVNHSGFLVAHDARVFLIDADSFQFRHGETLYPCHVGVPEYTPPELSGRPLSEVERTANHDAFGLAVVLFQLLFMGRHPFAGVATAGTVTVSEAIAGHRFAWSRRRRTGLSPPPGAADLEDLPEAVADLFERAFAPEGVEARPAAAEWVDALALLAAALVACGASLRHHHADAAPACPWCRMEGASGTVLFLLPHEVLAESAGPDAPPPLPPFDAAKLLARIRAVDVPDRFVYAPPAPQIEGPLPAPPKRSRWPQVPRLLGGLVMLAVGGVNVVMIPQNWLMSAPVFVAGTAWVRDWFRPERPALQDLQTVDARLSRTFVEAARAVDLDTPFLLKAELEGLVAARSALPVRLAEAERDVQAARAGRQRAAYLSRLRIAHATITGAADDLAERLAAAGVETAADVARLGPARLPDVKPEEAAIVWSWLSNAQARFRPDPSLPAEDRAELVRRHREEVERARAIDRQIEEGLARLNGAAAAPEAARSARRADVDDLLVERLALVREIEGLGRTAPPPPASPPRHLRAETRARAAALRSSPPA